MLFRFWVLWRESFTFQWVIISILCAAAFTLAGAGFSELINIKRQLVAAEAELASSKERIARLELWAVGVASTQEQLLKAAGSANEANKTPPSGERGGASLDLSSEEIQQVRNYIRLPPAPRGATPTIVLGAALAAGTLLPLPQQIVEKVPKLAGARFTTDWNGAIIIVRKDSGQADAIVPPN
jgi:hypothetical protein